MQRVRITVDLAYDGDDTELVRELGCAVYGAHLDQNLFCVSSGEPKTCVVAVKIVEDDDA